MSQELNNSYKKPRRTRAPRNRPMLITADNETTASEQPVQELPPLEEVPTQVAEPEPTLVEPSTPKARRLPAFFSKVGKNENADEQKEVDVAQARLARATRGKPTSTGKVPAAEKAEPKTEAKTTQPATKGRTAPPSTFKTRYILGIAIYLFAANFIGYGITALLNQFRADRLLAQFTLFGGKVIVRTSTVLFLAVLVIILVLLARFDLIPRTLGGTASRNRGQSPSRNNDTPGTRQIPPPIKQGVKGTHDNLYQAYRQNQRKKR